MKIHLLQGSRRTSGEQASTEWFDLDGTSQEDLDWLERDANLDRSSARLLLNALPHSRCVQTDAGILITLVRPDDAKGDGHQDLEVWLESERVITICRGAESVVADVAARVDEGSERGDCMSLLATLTVSLVRPLENDIAELNPRSGLVVLTPEGRVIARWSGYGHEPGNLIWPHDLAVSRRAEVFVGEVQLGKRIQKFRPDCGTGPS